MAGSQAKFVFRANHSEALDSANFGFLDFEIARKHGPELCEKDLLSCRHIGGSAHHLYRLRATVIYGSDVKMVGIRMGLAGKHLCNNHILETSFDDLLLLHRVDFYSY